MTRFTLGLFVLLTCAALPLAPAAGGEKKPGEKMVYELRTYTTAEGKLPALHARFRDHTMRLFEKHGIQNIAYWTPVDKENTLVYLIGHASRAAADKSWKAFSADPDWQKAKAASQRNGKLVTAVRRQYLTPTDYSPTQSGGLGSVVKIEGLVYELRTYTTNEDKLEELHDRFRDHTMDLFKKHGMINLIYTTPLDEKTADNTLVYLIAHEGNDAAKKSWDSFRSDPFWKKAYQKSIAGGRLVKKVDSQYLRPTDYTPQK